MKLKPLYNFLSNNQSILNGNIGLISAKLGTDHIKDFGFSIPLYSRYTYIWSRNIKEYSRKILHVYTVYMGIFALLHLKMTPPLPFPRLEFAQTCQTWLIPFCYKVFLNIIIRQMLGWKERATKMRTNISLHTEHYWIHSYPSYSGEASCC